MVPAAPRLPQQPGDAGGAEPSGGVSPPGAGTQLGAGRQVSSSSFGRPRGYTISSHKGEAPVRSRRGAGERKAGEGAERPRRRLWVPRPSQPPTSSSFTSSSPGSFFGRPRRGARRGRASGRRSTGSFLRAPRGRRPHNSGPRSLAGLSSSKRLPGPAKELSPWDHISNAEKQLKIPRTT